jgi:hypothetical protein
MNTNRKTAKTAHKKTQTIIHNTQHIFWVIFNQIWQSAKTKNQTRRKSSFYQPHRSLFFRLHSHKTLMALIMILFVFFIICLLPEKIIFKLHDNKEFYFKQNPLPLFDLNQNYLTANGLDVEKHPHNSSLSIKLRTKHTGTGTDTL